MRRFARALGATLFGVRAGLVEVQVSMPTKEDADEMPHESVFRIVGLPDSALKEGRERIRSAVAHTGWTWPFCPVTVNLAPAASRKGGAGLDLPIALGVLAASGVLPDRHVLSDWLCVGELGLDGHVLPVRGVLAAVESARRKGVRYAVVPAENAQEAAAVKGMGVLAARTLEETVGHLTGERPQPLVTPVPWAPRAGRQAVDLGVRGQPVARQAARVAAAGGHNLLLCGPPGAGKTLLARQITAWLPPLAYEEALEISRIHSVAGLLDGGLVTARPFRAPHHTTSLAGLIGGGSVLRPGEVSLAHLGVLFLDELAEFGRAALEALRQPIEDGRIVLGRASGRAAFPTEVMLVGATNPCPCGWAGVGDRCICRRGEIQRYRNRISGPIRDRFDLEVQVPPVEAEDLVHGGEGVSASLLETERSEAARARRMQQQRAKRLGLARAANARIPAALLPRAVEPTRDAERNLVRQARTLGFSGRGIHRVLRVARTIADLDASEQVTDDHVLQAIACRVG